MTVSLLLLVFCASGARPFQRGMSGRLSFTVAAFSKLVRPFYIPLARGGPLDAKFEPQLRR